MGDFAALVECECDGEYPHYGVAPHECFWRKGPDYTIGQSTLTPIVDHDCFVPDLEEGEDWSAFVYPSACGTWYCPQHHQAEYRTHWEKLIARIGPPPVTIQKGQP